MAKDVYEPAALVARLTVGTRVAIRVSPEQRYDCCGIYVSEGVGDVPESGRIEQVFEVPPSSRCWQCGHYGPQRGVRFAVRCGLFLSAYPAAALTPIEEEPET